MSWVEDYRALFDAPQRCVYFDTSYDCGGSSVGRAAVQRYFDDWADAAVENERGGPGRARFFRVADETRSYLATLLGGVDPAQICFTRNTNEGINIILQGFRFRPGENVVFHSFDHDSVVLPCLSARDCRGVPLKIVPAKGHCVTAEELIAACDEHTRMIVTSHVQPATGYCIDLKLLGDFCRSRGIFLVVDAIQSLGMMPFEAEKWGVDAVAAAGYKWLGAINSIGFLYLTGRLAREVAPCYAAAGPYVDFDPETFELICTDPAKARKFENSSLDNPGIYALHDGVRKLLDIGVERIAEHAGRLTARLIEGLKALGYTVVTPADPKYRATIVSLLPGDKQAMFDFFRSKNIALSISHGRFLRFGVAPYNTDADVDAVLHAAGVCPLR